MTETVKHTPGKISRLPVHNGDGYSWGGDLLVTFVDQSVNLGCGRGAEKLATLIASAPEMLDALHAVDLALTQQGKEGTILLMGVRAAISKAEGRS